MKEKTGLWKTESKKGNNYYKGKIKLKGIEYNVALFKNEKNKETSPDLMLYLEEKKFKEKSNYTVDEIVHSDFEKGTEEIKDEDLAF